MTTPPTPRLVVLLLGATLALGGIAGAARPALASDATVRVSRSTDGVVRLSNSPRPGRSATRSVPSATPTGSSTRVRRLPASPPYSPLIRHFSEQRDLDPRLVASVIMVESDFEPRARSSKGAQGLMQLMPDTAKELAVRNVWDPADNIRGGTLYLRRMLDRFGSLELALAAYNAGPTAVGRYGKVPPYPETIRYVEKVMGLVSGRGYSVDSGSRAPRARSVVVVRGADDTLVIRTRD